MEFMELDSFFRTTKKGAKIQRGAKMSLLQIQTQIVLALVSIFRKISKIETIPEITTNYSHIVLADDGRTIWYHLILQFQSTSHYSMMMRVQSG
jgi:hypothetical protein